MKARQGRKRIFDNYNLLRQLQFTAGAVKSRGVSSASLWTGMCYFIGHQSDRLYGRLCRLLGRWDARKVCRLRIWRVRRYDLFIRAGIDGRRLALPKQVRQRGSCNPEATPTNISGNRN
jgi:hypothetical protein